MKKTRTTQTVLVTGGAGFTRPPRQRAEKILKIFWYTYVLLSLRDGKFYIGCTNSLKKRLLEHNKGKVFATKYRRPLKLIYCEICLNKLDAIKREKYFKTGFGRRFLKNRLENYFQLAGSRGGRVGSDL